MEDATTTTTTTEPTTQENEEMNEETTTTTEQDATEEQAEETTEQATREPGTVTHTSHESANGNPFDAVWMTDETGKDREVGRVMQHQNAWMGMMQVTGANRVMVTRTDDRDEAINRVKEAVMLNAGAVAYDQMQARPTQRGQQAATPQATPQAAPKATQTGGPCKCGCGVMTKRAGAKWAMGHDSQANSAMKKWSKGEGMDNQHKSGMTSRQVVMALAAWADEDETAEVHGWTAADMKAAREAITG